MFYRLCLKLEPYHQRWKCLEWSGEADRKPCRVFLSEEESTDGTRVIHCACDKLTCSGITDSSETRKWKWLLGNSCECNAPVSAPTGYLNWRKCGGEKQNSIRVNRSIERRSRKHCWHGKVIMYYISSLCVCSLTYSACSAHAPYFIVICVLSGSTIFFHIIS